MTTQTPSIAIPTRRRGSGRRRLLGLTGAAIIAVVAGASLWQVERSRDATDTAPPQPTTAVARPAVVQATEAVVQTVYVVGSQAQADATQAALAEANAVREQLGAAPLADLVTVVADAEADAFFRMMGEQDAVRANLGLPSMVVVDLRSQPSATVVTLPADTRGGLAELYAEQAAAANESSAASAVHGTTTSPQLDPAAFADQEMYARWEQAQVVPGPERVSHPQADRFADEAARMSTLGGGDTPYRTSDHATCGTVAGAQAC